MTLEYLLKSYARRLFKCTFLFHANLLSMLLDVKHISNSPIGKIKIKFLLGETQILKFPRKYPVKIKILIFPRKILNSPEF